MNSLLCAKFIPGLNTIAPPMAGMLQRSFFSFFWRDFLGSLLYCGALILPGFFFEKQILEITAILEKVSHSLLLAVLVIFSVYALLKFVRLKLLQRSLYRERITPEELHDRIRKGEDLTVIDLRSNIQENEWLKVPGATRVHPGEIDQHITGLDRERWIVMYCNCPNEFTSARVAKLLFDRGYRKVRPLTGGFEAWRKAGFPVESL